MTATTPHPHAARRAVHIQLSEEDKAVLWAMTVEQRDHRDVGRRAAATANSWNGLKPAPTKFPSLGGEFAWLMMFTPEFADAAEQHRNNVVQLPERSQRPCRRMTTHTLAGADYPRVLRRPRHPPPRLGHASRRRCAASQTPTLTDAATATRHAASTSTHGAWHCHGCGASGGAFDAAIAKATATAPRST